MTKKETQGFRARHPIRGGGARAHAQKTKSRWVEGDQFPFYPEVAEVNYEGGKELLEEGKHENLNFWTFVDEVACASRNTGGLKSWRWRRDARFNQSDRCGGGTSGGAIRICRATAARAGGRRRRCCARGGEAQTFDAAAQSAKQQLGSELSSLGKGAAVLEKRQGACR